MPARFALFVGLGLLIAPATASEDPAPDTPEAVLNSIELAGEMSSKGPFKVGKQIRLKFGLKNMSKSQAADTQGLRMVQHWIGRLEEDSTIAAITAQNPKISKVGSRYAAGGYVLTGSAAVPKTIKAGRTHYFDERRIETTGFPQGMYRYYVELKDANGNVLTTKHLDFELK